MEVSNILQMRDIIYAWTWHLDLNTEKKKILTRPCIIMLHFFNWRYFQRTKLNCDDLPLNSIWDVRKKKNLSRPLKDTSVCWIHCTSDYQTQRREHCQTEGAHLFPKPRDCSPTKFPWHFLVHLSRPKEHHCGTANAMNRKKTSDICDITRWDPAREPQHAKRILQRKGRIIKG